MASDWEAMRAAAEDLKALWSMRILRDPKENLDTFRSYLEWKLEEYDSGRLRRDGPRW